MRGTLFIVAAPSGAGKSSIVNACLARDPNIRLSISFTSRAPRPGERHAEHYHFVSADEFQRMVADGDFFEHALVHGDWKGTAKQSVEPQLAAGQGRAAGDRLAGRAQVRKQVPDAVSVFILPPSRRGAGAAHAQARRRTARRRSSAGSPPRARRCRTTTSSTTSSSTSTSTTAVDEMCAIFVASRLRRPQVQQARHGALIAALLRGPTGSDP